MSISRYITHAIAFLPLIFLTGCKSDVLDWVLGKNVHLSLTEEDIATQLKKSIRDFDTSNLTLSVGWQPPAWITPQGNLVIDGTVMSVDEQQRALLMQYRAERRTHMVQTYSDSLTQFAASLKAKQYNWADILSGNSKEVDKRSDEVSKKMTGIPSPEDCASEVPMLATQNKLSTSLPAFAPYATLTQEKIDACWQQQKIRQARLSTFLKTYAPPQR